MAGAWHGMSELAFKFTYKAPNLITLSPTKACITKSSYTNKIEGN
jgi:hypothetical protein